LLLAVGLLAWRLKTAATLAAVRSAVGDGFAVFRALGLGGLAGGIATAVEGLSILGFDLGEGVNVLEGIGVRGLFIDVVSLGADGSADAAVEAVAVVIEDGFKGAFVNDGLIVIEAGAVFSFVGLDGDRAEFDALVSLPRLGFKLEEFDSVEADVLEGFEEIEFGVGARNKSSSV